MSNKKENIKREMKETFNKIAKSFGEVGPKYWDEFGNRLVKLSNIKEGAEVLDVGMGRGASLFPAIKKVGENGKVIGIDISENMVKETYKEISIKSIENAKVLVMDVDKLEFNNQSFDNIIGGFVFGYFLFSENRFDEILRVLKKGGQVGFSMWGNQEDQKWLNKLIKRYIPVNKKSENKEKSTIPDFSTVEGVKKILNNSGFKNIKVYKEENKVIYKDKNEWWQEMWSNAARNTLEKIDNLGRSEIEEFKKEVFNELEEFRCEQGFCFTMPVIYALGTK